MKREEFLIETDNVRVRVMELLPGDTTPWHFHREVADALVVVLQGREASSDGREE